MTTGRYSPVLSTTPLLPRHPPETIGEARYLLMRATFSLAQNLPWRRPFIGTVYRDGEPVEHWIDGRWAPLDRSNLVRHTGA